MRLGERPPCAGRPEPWTTFAVGGLMLITTSTRVRAGRAASGLLWPIPPGPPGTVDPVTLTSSSISDRQWARTTLLRPAGDRR
jgi:hypothetical protein